MPKEHSIATMFKLFFYLSAVVPYLTFSTLAQIHTIQPETESHWDDNVDEIDPPTNLSVDIRGGNQAQFFWDPPASNRFSRFFAEIKPLSSEDEKHEFMIDDKKFLLNTILEPGGTYQFKVFTEYQSQISKEFAEANFTTKPNAPDRFIVWYRNETSLLIYWQPPSGFIDSYKIEIHPSDSDRSVLYVTKEEYQSGRMQPGFYNLVPGRKYTIQVVSISANQVSKPKISEYRTVPLAPRNVTIDLDSIDTNSFIVHWIIPEEEGEYDGHNVSVIKPGSMPVQKWIPKDKKPEVLISDDSLQPGMTYEVKVKSVSGKVSSQYISVNVTLKSDAVSY